MKSKASYFSVSFPLIKENLRRFWAIPAISFLVYFLSGIFPILMSYPRLNDMSNFIENMLENMHPFYMAAHLIVPIVTAVIIFRYLQGSSSVTSMHAMPFTRAKLYNSNVLSGLILTLAPIALTGLILLAISKPVHHSYYEGLSPVNVFARLDILNWMWASFIIVLFIYAVAVFAGLVTGNSIMHLFMGFGFNFLIPALLGVFSLYCSEYLYGFDMSGTLNTITMATSPYIQILDSRGTFSGVLQLCYILAALAIFAVSFLLYYKRKLEKATDTFVFGVMIPVISYLIAFFGMVLIGFYFQALGNSDAYFYGGLFSGALIFFIIGRMIVLKTPRIFNARSVKSFGIYLVIAALFVCSFTFDITGFEKRVPGGSAIQSVAFGGYNIFSNDSRFSAAYFKGPDKNNDIAYNYSHTFTSSENIDALRNLHQAILNLGLNSNERNSGQYYYTGIRLHYNLGGAPDMYRSYSVDYRFRQNSADLKEIFESSEFKSFYSLYNLTAPSITSIDIQDVHGFNRSIRISGKAKIDEFIACMEKDFQSQTYADAISLKNNYAVASVNFKNPSNTRYEDALSCKITRESKNTIRWIKDAGYADEFEITPDMVSKIVFYKSEYGYMDYAQMEKMQYATDTATPNSVEITDKDQIRQVLDTYETDQIAYNSYYGIIVYEPGYYDYDTSRESQNIYYSEATAPGFIKNAF